MKTSNKLNLLRSDTLDKETKLWYILRLLHNDEISLNKAGELCQEVGLFSKHWIELDARFIEFIINENI